MYNDHGVYLYKDIDDFIEANKAVMNINFLKAVKEIAKTDPDYLQDFIYHANQTQIFEYMENTYIPPLLNYLYNAGETVEKTFITKQFLSIQEEIKQNVIGLPPRMIFFTFPNGIKSDSLIKAIQPAIRGDTNGKKYCWIPMFPVPDMKFPSFIAYAIYNSYL